MFSEKLVRWSGLATIVGAIVLAVSFSVPYLLSPQGDIPFSVEAANPIYQVNTLFVLVGFILVFFGLLGLYARQAEKAGIVGVVVFALVTVFTMMLISLAWLMAFVVPSLAEAVPAYLDAEPTGRLGIGFMLGWLGAPVSWLLLGGLTLYTRVLPRWITLTFIGGVFVNLVLGFVLPENVSSLLWIINEVIAAASIGILGYGLWSQHEMTTTTTHHHPIPVGI